MRIASAEERSSVRVVLDKSITLDASKYLAFRLDSSEQTLLLHGNQVVQFFKTNDIPFEEMDFSEMAVAASSAPVEKSKEVKPAVEKKSQQKFSEDAAGGKETKIGIEVKKNEDFSLWYQQVFI